MRGRRGAVRSTRAVLALGLLALAGCGSSRPTTSSSAIPPSLLREVRPIGVGPRFQPPPRGSVVGACRSRLGARDGVHVEVFAENRVVIVAAGIGTRGPRTRLDGGITAARCYGAIVTLEPTGVVLVRRGLRLTLAQLFRAWGQPLSPTRVASFAAPAGTRVAVFLDGRRVAGPPGSVVLARHAEIVVEVGPHVPPHSSFAFPPGI